MNQKHLQKGRGISKNPKNRFETLELSPDYSEWTDEDFEQKSQTSFYKDTTKSFITYNNSPDIGYNASVNPYRGCEHGCAYCYARQTHEYLGFSAGLDFETKIMVKVNAPELLRKELSTKKWKPQLVGLSGVTDIYQPIERKLELTRRCLEVFAEFRNPVGLVTKNALVTRDLDILKELAKFHCVSVAISITTLNEDLRRVLEPRTSTSEKRLEAVSILTEAGIHAGVLNCPIIPGLNDIEIPALVKASAKAGAKFVGYNIVHLPYGLKDLFVEWLEQHFPEKKNRVINRIKEMRNGKLNDPRFGFRMVGEGNYAAQIGQMHQLAKRKVGLKKSDFKFALEHFRVPGRATQIPLFDEALYKRAS